MALFKITSEEPRVTIQVADRPQKPTWCYLNFQASFFLHRAPWWGWTVLSTSQKRKTVLFKFKILIKVNLKYKLQSKPLESIQIGIEYIFEKLKEKEMAFCRRHDPIP
jgi:hypothetical protein